MPGGDGTGPLGLGPGTGRWGAGYSAVPPRPGFFGRGRRRICRGAANPWAAPYPGEMPGEREVLKREAEVLKEQLRQVEARLEAVEAQEDEEV